MVCFSLCGQKRSCNTFLQHVLITLMSMFFELLFSFLFTVSNDILNPVMFYDDDYIDTIIVMMIITYLISYNPLRPLSSKKTLEICWLSESQTDRAVEPLQGAVGSDFKIDASYISPNVRNLRIDLGRLMSNLTTFWLNSKWPTVVPNPPVYSLCWFENPVQQSKRMYKSRMAINTLRNHDK